MGAGKVALKINVWRSAAAGIVRTADLAGYRSGPVFIRRSKHVPPPRDAVRGLRR
jgi:hypothetical protein